MARMTLVKMPGKAKTEAVWIDSSRELFLKIQAQLNRLEERLICMDEGTDYLMTRKEVAKLFQVEPTTVTMWHSCGKLPGVYTDPACSRVKYRHSDVMEFMKSLPPSNGVGGKRLKREALK